MCDRECDRMFECAAAKRRIWGFERSVSLPAFFASDWIRGYLEIARANPPMEGGFYVDRTDWWDELAEMPAPHIVVIEDADRQVGTAAFVGEIHAAILQAMGSVAVVTNGAVRDLEQVELLGFQLFSGNVSVSHSYAHVARVDTPLRVAGLKEAFFDRASCSWRPARGGESSCATASKQFLESPTGSEDRREGNSALLSVRSLFARRTAKSSAAEIA